MQSGLRSGIRIAQGTYIRLTVSKPIPVQVDGEPWIQPPGHIIISAAGPKVGTVFPFREPIDCVVSSFVLHFSLFSTETSVI